MALQLRRGSPQPARGYARANRLTAGYLVLSAAAVSVYYGHPPWQWQSWSVLGFASVAAVVAGVRTNRPSDPTAWYLLAAAICTLIVGDTTYNVLTDLVHQVQPFPSVADACYLLTYPLAALGLMRMVRIRDPGRDLPALIDALLLTTALGLLVWVFTVTPTVNDHTVPWTHSAVSVAYPLGDLVLLGVILRLLLGGGHCASSWLLIAGGLGLMGSDIAYAAVRLYGTWHVGSPADLGWIAFYTCWGTAGLLPSMTRVAAVRQRRRDVTAGRVLPLAMAALVAPTVLVVESVQRGLRDGVPIAAASVVISLLALYRLVLQGRAARQRDLRAQMRLRLRELRRHAYRDPLTGLGNALRLNERMTGALHRTAHAGCGGEVWLITANLDDFREINETISHQAGDEVLRAAAQRLRTVVRSGDLLIRPGGDEFAVLLADGSRAEHAEALAQRVVRAFDQPLRVTFGTIRIHVSVGVAGSADSDSGRSVGPTAVGLSDTAAPAPTTGPGAASAAATPADPTLPVTPVVSAAPAARAVQLMLRNVELAQRTAKAEEKGSWRRFEPYMHALMVERLDLRTALDGAADRGELELYYQPLVDLHGRPRVSGFESLVRWHHPVHGMIPPDRFIPLAEETGQIVAIGAWVLDRAVGTAALWNQGGGPPRSVAVNVSARQLLEGKLAAAVSDRISLHGLAPSLLTIEITETALLHLSTPTAAAELEELTDLGVRVAIDDFGTGYSSLARLRDLPVAVIKLDKSFITPLDRSPEARILVEGIVRMADGLGLDVVAEGVETEAQLEVLRGSGCTYGQGYLFSRPVPLERLTEAIRQIEEPL